MPWTDNDLFSVAGAEPRSLQAIQRVRLPTGQTRTALHEKSLADLESWGLTGPHVKPSPTWYQNVVWSNGVWTTPDKPLAQLIDIVVADVDRVFRQKIDAGYVHVDGHIYQIDEASQGKISSMSTLAFMSIVNATDYPFPADFTFRDRQNAEVAKTAVQMIGLGRGAGNYVRLLMRRRGKLKNDARGAADRAALVVIYNDIPTMGNGTTGWPANGA